MITMEIMVMKATRDHMLYPWMRPLKEMVKVTDEDIQKLDSVVLAQEHRK